MSILNVNTIQPVGSGQTITVTATNITASSATITAGGFTGNLTGNVTGTVNSSGIATFSNGIVVAAGSASAPSISPTGDSNTGIFFPAADTIAFAEGGIEAARFDSSGRLGIGTNTSLADILTVNDTNPKISMRASGTERAFLQVDSSTDFIVNNKSISNLIFKTSDTERVRIDSSGKFGVNTTTPGTPLHVTGSGIIAQFLTTTSSLGEGVGLGGGTNIGRVTSNGASTNLTFEINGTERARLDTSGRFGINTQSPSDRLHCDGTLRLGDNTWYHTIGAGTGNTEMVITANAGQGNATTAGTIIFKNSISAGAITERARITSAGWSKISNFGLYNDVNASYHEFNSNQNNWTVYLRNTNASPTGLRINYDTDSNGTGNEFLYCVGNATLRASIRSNGGLANFSANNSNLSDRNVKKDITPAADTWDCVKEWEIVNYRYKDQSDESDLNLGVIAQQVAEHCPEVITVFEEAKDDQPEKLGVKEQQMYWMAIKALQEAQERIEQLEARLNAAGL